MARQPITFVTSNPRKLEEFVAILGSSFPCLVTCSSVDLPELQGEPEVVAAEKCKLAANVVGGPVVVEDTSLCYNAMGGLPGVYIKWFLDKLTADGLPKLLAGFEDKSAYAQCILSFSEGPGCAPVNFVGRTLGHIVPPRGPRTFGWDPVFQPEGHDLTYAELPKEVKNTISHRYRAVDAMRQHFKDHASELVPKFAPRL